MSEKIGTKLLIALSVLLLVSGCTSAQTSSNDAKDSNNVTEQVKSKKNNSSNTKIEDPEYIENIENSVDHGLFLKKTSDGRTVECIWVKHYGIDCDWDNAKVIEIKEFE